MIRTVRGDINPSKLGVTMCHEHLSVDLGRIRNDDDSTFGYSQLVIDEINFAKELGVQAFVEMSTNDMGRNVNDLLKLSNTCDVHIIAPTGFYLDQYHPQYIHDMSEDDIAEIFTKDLTVGIDDTNIKAGVIGEVCTNISSFGDAITCKPLRIAPVPEPISNNAFSA